jgi:hypothetical protein
MARITMDGLQSLLNFMGAGAFLPEKIGDTSLFNFVHIDIMKIRKAGKCPMPAKTSRLSSVT